jgi:tRNA-dihydrouridine synthase
VRKILSRRRGGHLLGKPEQALEIVRAVVAASDRPVTVKLRIGTGPAGELPDEDFWRLAEGSFEAGVAALTVHARTVAQRYAGPARWDTLSAIKARYRDQTIIGSGDAMSPHQVVEMMQETGVDGVTIARGALGNPWIFRQMQDYLAGRPLYQPDLAEQRAVLEAHFADALALYGPNRGPKMMRKFGIKYARMHPHPAQVRVGFVAVRGLADWQAVLDKFYT